VSKASPKKKTPAKKTESPNRLNQLFGVACDIRNYLKKLVEQNELLLAQKAADTSSRISS